MMVSLKTFLFSLAAAATLSQVQARSHGHHKRYQYPPQQYYNETASASTYTPTSLLGTGYRTSELPIPTSSTVEPTLVPIFTPPPIEPAPVTTTCITKYETKTYTYTLGNGKAHTATVIHTNVITKTVTPIPEPTKDGSVGEYIPSANVQEDPEYSSTFTSTSTTTVLVTITRTLPLPDETTAPVVVQETLDAPCPMNTVYVTVPVSVSVIRETVVQTVKETVKETITVTQTPVSPHPPVYTLPPAHPPYSNHTTTETVHQVTLTVVPVPYQ